MRFIQYIKDTRSEFKHVSWPTRRQAIAYTIIVIAISLVTAIFLGVLDYFFVKLIESFI